MDVEGIGVEFAKKFEAAGAKTTKDLLEMAKTPNDREKLAQKTGISGTLILKWANRADLMRIKGIGGQYAELLERLGVNTVNELATRSPENLYAAVESFDLAKAPIIRQKPTINDVKTWVNHAKRLEPTLKY
jgi:predicted flap endonuclease-1-like 5' DNA nuclease